MEIGQPVPEKTILTDFYQIRACNLGHVTSIMSSDFHFLVPGSFYTKFCSDRHRENPVLEKKMFEGFLPYMGVAAILVM